MDNLNRSRQVPLTQAWVTLHRLLELAPSTIPCNISENEGKITVTLQFQCKSEKRHSPAKIKRDFLRKRQYLDRWNRSRAESMSTLSEGANSGVEEECTPPVTPILENVEQKFPKPFSPRIQSQPSPYQDTVESVVDPEDVWTTATEKCNAPIMHYFFWVKESIRNGQNINEECGSKKEVVQEVVETQTIMQESPVIPTHDVSSVPATLEATKLYGPGGTEGFRTSTAPWENLAVSPRNPGDSVPNTTQETLETPAVSPGIFSTAVGWVRALIHPPATAEPYWV